MQIVVAPDSFKGSATAAEVAAAIAAGWGEVRPGDLVVPCPMADGGEGTLDAIAAAEPAADRMPVTVTGPDDQSVSAAWLLLPDGTAVVELALTSGLALTDLRRPLHAHTRGFGQAVVSALDSGAERLLLAVGGSATTDGGTGLLTELGARFTDAEGERLRSGGGALGSLFHADLTGVRALPPGGVEVLTDVTSPLLGPLGAARLFGPQKGASPSDVEELEQGLVRLAETLGVDAATAGAGAAGGAGYAVLVWGGRLVSGAAGVAAAVGLREKVAVADLVITGEGRFDGQSGLGKTPSFVRETAAGFGRPVALVAGMIAAEPDGYDDAVSLTDLAGSSTRSQQEPLRYARRAGAQLARRASSLRRPAT